MITSKLIRNDLFFHANQYNEIKTKEDASISEYTLQTKTLAVFDLKSKALSGFLESFTKLFSTTIVQSTPIKMVMLAIATTISQLRCLSLLINFLNNIDMNTIAGLMIAYSIIHCENPVPELSSAKLSPIIEQRNASNGLVVKPNKIGQT